MIAPLLIAMTVSVKPGPVLPPLTSAVFQDLVLSVEQSLEKGDFEGAKKKAAFLPRKQFAVSIDDRKLPAAQRPAFRAALAAAAKGWRGAVIFVKPKGDVQFSFQPTLAVDAQTGAPANVATFFSDLPTEPRLEAVVGLRRGAPTRQTTAEDFYNDARFAIGTYLGLAKYSLPFRVMNGSQTEPGERGMSAREMATAAATVKISDFLRAAAESKTKLSPSGRADVFVDPAAFEGEGVQGDQLDLPVQVTNRGTGTLAVSVEGDCGCIVPEQADPVAPGMSGLVKVRFDTRELTGPVERQIILFTNDPEMPARAIPVRAKIAPRYRFLMPGGDAITVDEGGATSEIFLSLPDGEENDMKVLNARIIGLEGASVTYEAWTGVMADPAMKEPERPRHGYKFKVKVPDTLPPGRSPVNIALVTNVPQFTELYHTIYLQRGIVAQPEELFLGEVARKPKTSNIVLTRPGRPFEVKSVRSTLPNFTVKALPGSRPDEIKLQITYDGLAPAGRIEGAIIVETNDPKQPQVRVPIVGSTT
jgi:hypothetical protein